MNLMRGLTEARPTNASRQISLVGRRSAEPVLRAEFGYWGFRFAWNLELGSWDLPRGDFPRRGFGSFQIRLKRARSEPIVANFRGALAQLVRALPCHGRGCGFEPRRLRFSSLKDRPDSRQFRDNRAVNRLTVGRFFLDHP